ncbi:hypothetical protein ACETU7_31205 [Rhodococcus sp. 3Y1]
MSEVTSGTKSVPQEQVPSPYAAELPQPRPNRHEQRFDPAADLVVADSDQATDGFSTERDADTEAVMVDAQAYSAMYEAEGPGQEPHTRPGSPGHNPLNRHPKSRETRYGSRASAPV